MTWGIGSTMSSAVPRTSGPAELFLGRQQCHAVSAFNHTLQDTPQSVGFDCLLSGHGYWLR